MFQTTNQPEALYQTRSHIPRTNKHVSQDESPPATPAPGRRSPRAARGSAASTSGDSCGVGRLASAAGFWQEVTDLKVLTWCELYIYRSTIDIYRLT